MFGLICYSENILKSKYQGFNPGSFPGTGRSAGEGIGYSLLYSWASLAAQLVKNPPAMWETWVRKILWRRERLPSPALWPGKFHGLYSPCGHKESDMTEQLSLTKVSKVQTTLPKE